MPDESYEIRRPFPLPKPDGPVELRLEGLSMPDIQGELARGRILSAVQRHILDDMNYGALGRDAGWDIDFTLSFTLKI
jgi:hypothetical protein